jgi:hypothetical protein
MPDTKITALTAIGANPIIPSTFPIPMVDLTDTSMAASGTTKKVTVNQILGAGGTATLASATITGDLTVDTSTLKVDSANDRVLIGTLSALGSAKLSILGKTQADTAVAGDVIGNFNNTSATGYGLRIGGGSATGGYSLSVNNNAGSEFFQISGTGVATWSNVGGVAGTAMTLNSTGLGIGLTPVGGVKLSVAGTIYANGGNALILDNPSSNFVAQIKNTGSSLQSTLAFLTGSGTSMLIDNSGNVGIGVTPSAGAGCLQLVSGINFPATQVASANANTLDDYEEGNFTPVVQGSTTAGAGTYSSQSGRYTKTGRLVTVEIYLAWSAHTGSGNFQIGGLPFNSNSSVYSGASIGLVNNIALSANNTIAAFNQTNTSYINIVQTPVGGGAFTDVPLDTSGLIVLTCTYSV